MKAENRERRSVSNRTKKPQTTARMQKLPGLPWLKLRLLLEIIWVGHWRSLEWRKAVPKSFLHQLRKINEQHGHSNSIKDAKKRRQSAVTLPSWCKLGERACTSLSPTEDTKITRPTKAQTKIAPSASKSRLQDKRSFLRRRKEVPRSVYTGYEQKIFFYFLFFLKDRSQQFNKKTSKRGRNPPSPCQSFMEARANTRDWVRRGCTFLSPFKDAKITKASKA